MHGELLIVENGEPLGENMKTLASVMLLGIAMSTTTYAGEIKLNLGDLLKAVTNSSQPNATNEKSSEDASPSSNAGSANTSALPQTKPQKAGGLFPIGWSDKEYTPDVLDGSRHLRIGSNGLYLRNPYAGPKTCDAVYLYYAKSDKSQISDNELEYCALLEFHIYRSLTGDKRDMGDGFVKRETIAEFSKAISARIEELKKNDAFYIRTTTINIEPYNFNTKSFSIYANMDGGSAGDSPSTYYWFDGVGFDSNAGIFHVNLSSDGERAKEIEAARAKGRGVGLLHGMNEIHFRVKKTKDDPRASSPSKTRRIEIEVFKFKTYFVRPDGSVAAMGFEK